MELLLLVKIFFSLTLITFFPLLIRLYKALLFNPEKLRSILRKQGIRGPTPSFLYGNILEMKRIQSTAINAPTEGDISHDCASIIFPFMEQWRKEYGETFMFSLGNLQLLHLTQPDVVKEMSMCTSFNLGKPGYQQKERGALLGHGILTSNGAYWAHQRKIIAPELYMDKVKGMVNLMVESATSLLKSWETRIDQSEMGIGDIRVDQDMRSFSGDVISRACFGSNFSKGKEIFSRLRFLQEAMAKPRLVMGLPFKRYIPSKNNREIWRLEKEVSSLILNMVKERREATFENDLLQMILEGANYDDQGIDTDQFIVDNCKNIYLAGYETIAVTATWILMLLASHPEWQDRVRTEALEVCRDCLPDYDILHKMKVLTMVINETLRLYPPAAIISREALEEMKFGDLNVPKGVNLWIPVLSLHTDPEIWGSDAFKFKPERFANGIIGATSKNPYAYMPFGIGPRICLGQNFSLAELKVLISLIVSKFYFSLSPKYHHFPTQRLIIEPADGLDLIIKKV